MLHVNVQHDAAGPAARWHTDQGPGPPAPPSHNDRLIRTGVMEAMRGKRALALRPIVGNAREHWPAEGGVLERGLERHHGPASTCRGWARPIVRVGSGG